MTFATRLCRNRVGDAGDAGWSSPVARQAHNLKVAGSNPAPATKSARQVNDLAGFSVSAGFIAW